MKDKKRDPLITRKNYQEYQQKKTKENPSRLTEKERGRRLDTFYNWSIIIVAIAIILVFVLAFFI